MVLMAELPKIDANDKLLVYGPAAAFTLKTVGPHTPTEFNAVTASLMVE